MVKIFKEGISKNIISLLLCISIVTSCMYVYSKEYLLLFVAITFVIQASVFSFYTYLSGKSMILKFISVLGSFAAIIGMVTIALKTGNNKSSIDYFIWFLSPQALVEFSMPYIVATFIVINFFIASTVYYFSAVRYRISMSFLITLIPFAFYRKEGEKVPAFFALLLLVMYIALMIHCRQLNSKPNHRTITDSGYKKSMILFLAFSTFLAFLMPKPQIGKDNSWVDSVFESEKITNYMLNRLGIVSETASSSVTYTSVSDVRLYEFIADESPINLKSQTYSTYNYEKNLWRTRETELYGMIISDTSAEALNPADFYRAVAAAADLDKNFAEKYSLEGLNPELNRDYSRKVSMISSRVNAKYYYTPVLSYSVRGLPDNDVYRSENGMLFSEKPVGTNYSVKYYSDQIAYNKAYMKITKSLDMLSFGEFLDEIQRIFDENSISEFDNTIEVFRNDYTAAEKYLSDTFSELPESIVQLTEKIIRKSKSDYEKANAIQNYFRLNDFTYDLKYVKPDKYNMEYFLTEGKTGICSDYATAMVLIARQAGIPARYAEGIHLHDPDENGIVTVRDSDLHAFPELYIAGYGWMSFEPTQIAQAEEKKSFDYGMSVILCVFSALLIAVILLSDKFIIPFISDKVFKAKLKRVSDGKAVEMTVNRIRKVLGLDESMTSGEISSYVCGNYGILMNDTAEKFDSIVYGSDNGSQKEREDAIALYDKVKEKLKENSRRKRG